MSATTLGLMAARPDASSPAPAKGGRGLFRRKKQEPGAPKPPGRFAQIRTFYTQTSKVDKSIPLWTWGSLAVITLVFIGIGFLINRPILMGITGLMLGLLVAMTLMTRKGEKAMFSQIAGHQGSVSMALRGIRGKLWVLDETPVAIDPRTKDMVFRLIGPAGIVLVSEGPAHRVTKLLAQEERRVKRVASGAPVTLVQGGENEGQVPVAKLARHVMRLKTQLTKAEISEVSRRMRSIGGVNTAVPKGVDPNRMKVDRRAMRGR